jgi:hypothetical protein
MVSKQPKNPKSERETTRFTARLTWAAYDALADLQRQQRRKSGKVKPLWKILDAAVRVYAKQQGIRIGE